MFFPIRTDRRLNRTPWVNYTLIAVNVLIFMLTDHTSGQGAWRQFMLMPSLPRPWQFLTYQFLHQDVMHLGGNMLFLYVFGNSVEDRLGKFGYLGFYLSGGVLAGLGHAVLSLNPVLGASGAVCAVTGAYLALFPLSKVTVVYWFFVVGALELSGFIVICFQIVQDVVMFLLRSGGVAYMAHMSGYLFGFAIGLALLLTRLLPREPYDLLSLADRRKRRREFRTLTDKGYRPWELNKVEDPPPAGLTPVITIDQQRLMDLRAKANLAATNHDLKRAADSYVRLLELDPGQVLTQQNQLDIANQLMAENRHALAANAYELFLNTYRSYAQRAEIELILALIYTRYLNRRQRARELLKSALSRLQDPDQKEMAQHALDEIQ